MPETEALHSELTRRQIADDLCALVAVLRPDGAVEIVNRQVLDYFGKASKQCEGDRVQRRATEMETVARTGAR